MKKRFLTLAVILGLLVMAFPAMAALQDMHATVYRWTGGYLANGSPQLTIATTGITYQVLAHDSDTAETLYVYDDRGLTAKTNPVTTTVFATNKRVEFKVDPTDSTDDRYVDLIVTDTVGGYSAVVKHFDQYTHNIIIDERPNITHHGLIWYSATTTDEKSTGVSFVADTMIHDVRTEVVTTSTSGTISVGTLSTAPVAGDADGFIATRSAATAGYTADTGVITAGTSVDYNAVSTYGALLYTAITGTDTHAVGLERNGGRSYLGRIVTSTGSDVISYTCSTTGNSGAGYIHYWFTRLR